MKSKYIAFSLLIILVISCNNKKDEPEIVTPPEPVTPVIGYVVTNSFPHDTASFTEGFLIHKGVFWESTGAAQYLPQTRSLFGILDTITGKISTKIELDKSIYFGEGITILNGKVYQLTYTNKIGFVYDVNSFAKLQEFKLPTEEGWGMTTDGKNLIMSDGTNLLTYLDTNSLLGVKIISVSENGHAVDKLNELEFIDGYIYANIWPTSSIVKIDTSTGKVVGRLNLSVLADDARAKYSGALEMNGIAYDSVTQKVYITGKMWPEVYEIKFDF
jgi:glutamine cyclotransferase